MRKLKLEVVVNGTETSVEIDALGRNPEEGTICVPIDEVLAALESEETQAA